MTYDVKPEVIILSKKYIIFKDDDVGKDTQSLKKWIEIILEKNVKAAIGLIGKCMRNQELIDYLNSLDKDKIEIFCHGYYHKQLPYIIRKIKRSKELPKTEFNKDFERHNRSLKKYRLVESKYLKTKAITFGPQGNIWNDNVIDAVIQNDFKLMFSWRKIKADIFTIPMTENLKQNSFEEFLKDYNKNNNVEIYTLQFHHANLTDNQFELMKEVIDFLKNKEKRIFVKPSDLLLLVNK
jgi:hypothetical protein